MRKGGKSTHYAIYPKDNTVFCARLARDQEQAEVLNYSLPSSDVESSAIPRVSGVRIASPS